MARLNIKEAIYPRATHTLDGIKRLVYELEQRRLPSGGDVYYAVRKFAEYGKLSGRKLEDLRRGEWAGSQPCGVSSAPGDWRDEHERLSCRHPEAHKKKDPFDFALWKALNR